MGILRGRRKMHLVLFVKKGSSRERCPCVCYLSKSTQDQNQGICFATCRENLNNHHFVLGGPTRCLFSICLRVQNLQHSYGVLLPCALLIGSTHAFNLCPSMCCLHVVGLSHVVPLGVGFVWQVSNLCMLPFGVGVMWQVNFFVLPFGIGLVWLAQGINHS